MARTPDPAKLQFRRTLTGFVLEGKAHGHESSDRGYRYLVASLLLRFQLRGGDYFVLERRYQGILVGI